MIVPGSRINIYENVPDFYSSQECFKTEAL